MLGARLSVNHVASFVSSEWVGIRSIQNKESSVMISDASSKKDSPQADLHCQGL